MNIGYQRAKKYDAENIILLNNDIEFIQENFISLVKESYARQPFAVLGPDVVVPETHQHQNPKKTTEYSLAEVQNIHDKNQKIWDLPDYLFKLRARLKNSKILTKIYLKIKIKNDDQRKSIMTNVVLHGSILIFFLENLLINSMYLFLLELSFILKLKFLIV